MMKSDEMKNIKYVAIKSSILSQLAKERSSDVMLRVYLFLHTLIEDTNIKTPMFGIVNKCTEASLFREYENWMGHSNSLSSNQFIRAFKRLDSLGYIKVMKGNREMIVFLLPAEFEKDDCLSYIARNKQKFHFLDYRWKDFWDAHGISDTEKLILSNRLRKKLAVKDSDQKFIKI